MKIALLADVHEDLESLQIALSEIRKLRCREVFFLGDISGFSVPHYSFFESRDACGCLRLIRECCSLIIAGNHDLHAARVLPGPGTEFTFPPDWYRMDYHQRLDLSGGKVWLYENDELPPLYRSADLEFIASLKEYEIFRDDGAPLLLTHFIRPNLSGSLRQFYDQPGHFHQHLSWMEQLGCSISFCGHVHADGIEVVDGKRRCLYGFRKRIRIEQPSVILLPAIAGNGRRRGFAVFDTGNRTVEALRV